MIDSNQIPRYKDTSPDGMIRWWHEMAELGLIIHPDDPPEEFVDIDSGEKIFTSEACSLLRKDLSSMLEEHGDNVYAVGQRELMRLMGWQENQQRNCWERIPECSG